MKILICMIIAWVILMLMLLGLLAMNEVVEGIKEIKKWGKDNE